PPWAGCDGQWLSSGCYGMTYIHKIQQEEEKRMIYLSDQRVSFDQVHVMELASALRGDVIQPADPGYEEARKLYNGMIDKRPALIARCTDVADVMAALAFGREHDLLIAVRGGGHNGPGLGSCDDGLVIDLSPMKGVRVDPEQRTVRVGPGCTQADVDHATHAFGLAVPA